MFDFFTPTHPFGGQTLRLVAQAQEGGGDIFDIARTCAKIEPGDKTGWEHSWLELAQLNSISYPYTIYPGQVLQLPAGKPTEPEPARVVVPGKAVETTVYVPLVFKNYASHKVTPADIITSLVSRFGGVPAKLRNP